MLITLQKRSQNHKRLWIRGRKTVCAFRDRRDASSLESAGQKLDVFCLVGRNIFQICMERVGEARFDEVCVRVVGKTFAVELVYQMLECECVVEDIICAEI